jgi:hypothetical protein
MNEKTIDPVTEDKKGRGSGSAIPGLAIFGCLVTGVLSWIAGLIGLGYIQIVGSGICFFVAAFAFGIVAYVSFHD